MKLSNNSNGNGNDLNAAPQPKIDKKKLKLQKKKEQKKRQKQKKADNKSTITSIATTTNGIKDENNIDIDDSNISNINSHKLISSSSSSSNNNNNNKEEEEFNIDENDPTFELYNKLLKHFDNPYKEDENNIQLEIKEEEEVEKEKENNIKIEEEINSSDDEEKKKKISNKERKRQKRLSLPILKQLVDRPDVVELHDVNSPNPSLLISMKSYKNTIQVPTHWCQKRKYLQGKRGFVKPPFELPSFIAATGITKIREAILEKEAEKKSKQKQRERVQPKMRRMDIDYQVLRDAFFVHQTKPKLSIQGDLYYEGKEFEISLKSKKPGFLSDELRRALGMGEGYPPPWLVHMQKVGPPPSYPNLRVPGVNSPIPEGCQYGTHPGGWGILPMNEFGKQLYMDPAGDSATQNNYVTREHWGELLHEVELDEDEMLDEDQDQQQQQYEQDDESSELHQQETSDREALDGISSVPSGLETPDVIDIKKSRYTDDGQPKQLYQVLEQSRNNSGGSGGFMDPNYKYNIPTIIKNQSGSGSGRNKVDVIKSQKSAPVEITFNPSELENVNVIDEDLLKKKYEQAVSSDKLNQQQSKTDYSDIIDEQVKKRKNQLQSQKDDKHKKFKF
eukprot:gene5329-6645_t